MLGKSSKIYLKIFVCLIIIYLFYVLVTPITIILLDECNKNKEDIIGTYLVNDSMHSKLTFFEDNYYDWTLEGRYQYEGNSKFIITYLDDITSELEINENTEFPVGNQIDYKYFIPGFDNSAWYQFKRDGTVKMVVHFQYKVSGNNLILIGITGQTEQQYELNDGTLIIKDKDGNEFFTAQRQKK